jgi:hypothetical protein
MYVLATVTHGYCPTEKTRRCDLRATEVSKLLVKLLKRQNIKYDVVTTHKNRSLVDLNRPKPVINKSKKNIKAIRTIKKYHHALDIWNSFNTRIIEKLKAHEHRILLDIHSFNLGSFGNAHIVILDLNKEHREELDKFAEIASLWLNIKVQVLDGGINYIQDTYRRLAYPILLEFCEDASVLPPETISRFFKLLLEYLEPIAKQF